MLNTQKYLAKYLITLEAMKLGHQYEDLDIEWRVSLIFHIFLVTCRQKITF